MGFKEFEILFDNPSNVWYPGQTVTGRVYISADKTESVRSLRLHFKGEADTSWQTNTTSGAHVSGNTLSVGGVRIGGNSSTMIGSQHSTRVYAHEEYFNNKYFLLGTESDGQVEIPFGDQYYKFACPLPTNIPTSFEGTYGSITYTMKAVVDRPWKFDNEKEVKVTIVDPFDLNQNPAISEKVQVEKSKTFCCLCCGTRPLSLILTLPVRGYVPEQNIPVRISYDNMSGIQIKAINIQLIKVITFIAHAPVNETKKDTTVIVEDTHFPMAGETSGDFITQIKIPPIQSGNLQNCRIINLDYYIKIVARMPIIFRNFVHQELVYIGTIPLINYQSPYDTNYSSVFQTQESAFEYVATAPSIAD